MPIWTPRFSLRVASHKSQHDTKTTFARVVHCDCLTFAVILKHELIKSHLETIHADMLL